MSSKASCISNFKMHCFVCDKTIYRGDEITQCLESGGMELRKVPYTGSRWVHQFCVPKDISTKYFMEVVDELTNDYPDTEFSDVIDLVESHDYWNHEDKLSSKNLCIDCGIDMGPLNPRQLCGKTFCHNETFSDISSEISTEELDSFDKTEEIKLTDKEKHRLIVILKKENISTIDLEKDIDRLCLELKKISWWSGKKIEEDKKIDIIFEMLIEKKKFDKIVDEALEILKKSS